MGAHFAVGIGPYVAARKRTQRLQQASRCPGALERSFGHSDNRIDVTRLIGNARREGSDQDEGVEIVVLEDLPTDVLENRPVTKSFRPIAVLPTSDAEQALR